MSCGRLIPAPLFVLAALPALAGGGVRVETRVKMMMMEGTAVQWLQADRQRTENHFEASGMMGAALRMGGGANAVVIERVDRGLVWTLNPDDKTYTERPMDALQRNGPPEKRKGGRMRIIDAGATVTPTGKQRNLNGWNCRQFLVEGWVLMEDEKTKERSKWVMKNEMWTTPESGALKSYHALQAAYARARMAKMGIQAGDAYASGMGLEMLGGRNGMSGGDLAPAVAKMAVEFRKLSGVPILTIFNWTIESKEAERAAAQTRDITPEQRAMMERMGIKIPASGAGGGIGIEGEMEITAVREEAGSFEIPADYKKKN